MVLPKTLAIAVFVVGDLVLFPSPSASADNATCVGCTNESCGGECYCAPNMGLNCDDGLLLIDHNCVANGGLEP